MKKRDTFKVRTPCANCPFRNDITPYLRQARVHDLVTGDNVFMCHKTLTPSMRVGKYSAACAGFLAFMERCGKRNQMMQVAERLGLYDPKRLNPNAPVYKSLDELLHAHKD